MKKDKAYLQDILDAILDIEKFVRDVKENSFYKNKEKQYAVLRGLEIIGEATKNLSKETRLQYSEIPWKDIIGMRDKLIHMYFGVKLELVWVTVRDKLPQLKQQIAQILKKVSD